MQHLQRSDKVQSLLLREQEINSQIEKNLNSSTLSGFNSENGVWQHSNVSPSTS